MPTKQIRAAQHRLALMLENRNELADLLDRTLRAEAFVAKMPRPRPVKVQRYVPKCNPPGTTWWAMGMAERMAGAKLTAHDRFHLDLHWQRLTLEGMGFERPSFVVRAQLLHVERRLDGREPTIVACSFSSNLPAAATPARVTCSQPTLKPTSAATASSRPTT